MKREALQCKTKMETQQQLTERLSLDSHPINSNAVVRTKQAKSGPQNTGYSISPAPLKDRTNERSLKSGQCQAVGT